LIAKLIWKEWVEQRWKLFLGCVMLMGFTLIGLSARVMPDIEIISGGVIVYAIVFPLFACMDLVAAERAEGTLPSLSSLPLSAWKVLAIKTAVGLAVCVVPMVATAMAACLLTRGREATTGLMLRVYGHSACLAAVLFIWMLAFSLRQPTEARAAVVGICVLAVLAVSLALLALFVSLSRWSPESFIYIHPVSLLIFVEDRDLPRLKTIIPVQAVLTCGLFVWAAFRFARDGRAA
jgi:ABC-type transport system involved in multi-copper enzyme maturation permease subunit